MKWGLNGLSRPCHITCFFTSTIRRRPRLTSRALLLSLFSMPDKLSGCRSFRFFSRKMASFRFSFTDSYEKKIFVQSLRKRWGSLKEPSQPPQKRKKILRTSPPQPWLDLSFLTAEIHQRVNVNAKQTDLFIA